MRETARQIGDQVAFETQHADVPSGEAAVTPSPVAPISQSPTDWQTEPMNSPEPLLRAALSARDYVPGGAAASSLPAAPIAAKPKAKRRQKAARCSSKPSGLTPPSAQLGDQEVFETHNRAVPGDEGREPPETQGSSALVATVNAIVEFQGMRKFCIKSQSRCDRSVESLIARYLGYHSGLPEKQRKALFRQAASIRQQVESGGGDRTGPETQWSGVPSFAYKIIIQSAESRRVWDEMREDSERNMEVFARQLPVWPWASQVRGLGAKGIAILVGEAGIAIGDYRTVSGLWSRFGLAVIDGIRQQRKTGELGKIHKFSPRRRAEVWAVCSDSLFRGQWIGDRDEDGKKPDDSGKPAAVPAHALGPYGEVYARRRAITAERVERTANLESDDPDKWSKGRAHKDACRIMTKELVKDLWVEWRRVTRSIPEIGGHTDRETHVQLASEGVEASVPPASSIGDHPVRDTQGFGVPNGGGDASSDP